MSARPVDAHDRRQGGHRAGRHADHPRRRAARHRDPAVLRSPVLEPAGACRQCYVRDRGPAASSHLLHHDRRAGHGRARRRTRARGRTRRRWRTSSSCCSTTRSTARSATAAASARCRTRRSRSGRATAATPRPSGLTRSRSRCRRWSNLDRERCVLCARCTRFCDEISGDRFIELFDRGAGGAGRDRGGRGLPLPVQRQHRPDLPGRRADRDAVPVRGAAVRPVDRSTPSAATAAPVATSGSTSGAARSSAQLARDNLRGERRLALRQGPVRVPVPRRARPDHDAADPRPRAGAGVLRRGAHRGSPTGARRRARRVPDRRTADGRGRLRAVQARAHGLRHERPRPPARRGAPRLAEEVGGRGTDGRSTYEDVERAKVDPGRRAGRRAGGADPAPAPAEGRQARREDRASCTRGARGCTTSPSTSCVRPARTQDGVLGGARAIDASSMPRRRRCARPGTMRRRSPASATARPNRRGGVAPRRAGARFALRHAPRERSRGARAGRAPGAAARRPAVRRRGGATEVEARLGADHGRRRRAGTPGILAGVRRSRDRRAVPGRRRSAARLPRRRARAPRAAERGRGRSCSRSSSARWSRSPTRSCPAAAVHREATGTSPRGRAGPSACGRSAAPRGSPSRTGRSSRAWRWPLGGDLGFETLDELHEEMGRCWRRASRVAGMSAGSSAGPARRPRVRSSSSPTRCSSTRAGSPSAPTS